MKTFVSIFCLATLAVMPFSHAQSAKTAAVKKDVEAAIAKGAAFLLSKQNAEGWWVTPDEPALSALVTMAIAEDPGRALAGSESAELTKAYDYLLKNVKPDGGIYTRARANYNTAISLTALTLRGRAADEEVIRKARKFVAGSQNDYDDKGKADNVFDGGIGYGDSKPGAPAHADLSNTTFALEALYLSKRLFEDKGRPLDKQDDLNWDAAIQFVQRCQNRPQSNDQDWAGKDRKDIGAFAYTPDAPGGGDRGKGRGGRVAMRYYGSISYAGMLSFIYAGLDAKDPRVTAAMEWLGQNFTLDENPGMGAEGLFYYYHTMAKALSTAGVNSLKTKSGTVDWREPFGRKLIELQSADGSWKNTGSGRWMEGEPVLVTAYSLLALEQLHRALK